MHYRASKRPRAKRCTLYRPAGSFSHTDKAGRNSFHFTGRVRGQKLKPDAYRLQAISRFAALPTEGRLAPAANDAQLSRRLGPSGNGWLLASRTTHRCRECPEGRTSSASTQCGGSALLSVLWIYRRAPYRPRTRASASSTACSSSASRRPTERPKRSGATTVVCSPRTRVAVRSRLTTGRKLAGWALVEVGETRTVLNPRSSSAWTTTTYRAPRCSWPRTPRGAGRRKTSPRTTSVGGFGR
jgi:hypothetical protein